MQQRSAEVICEYGPFPGIECVHGVTFDGHDIWLATGETLTTLDPTNGKPGRSLDAAACAGTAFDGQHLFQIAGQRIQRIDPETGQVLATIPSPSNTDDSGMAWAEGTLWVGQYKGRRILQIDPQTGAVLRTLESNRRVTGVTWVDDELWHGTWEDGESDIRQIDPHSGEVRQRLELPADTHVSGLESDGADRFFCGGGPSGRLRFIRRPGLKD